MIKKINSVGSRISSSVSPNMLGGIDDWSGLSTGHGDSSLDGIVLV
jgi:hypothetical protein